MSDFVSYRFAECFNSLVTLVNQIKYNKELKSFYLSVKKELVGIQHLVHHAYDLEEALRRSEELEALNIDLYIDHVSKLIWLLRHKGVPKEEISDYIHWDIMDIFNAETDGEKPERNPNPMIKTFKLESIIESKTLSNEELKSYMKKWIKLRRWVEQEKSKHLKAWERFERSKAK